jgi:hypothetical protein
VSGVFGEKAKGAKRRFAPSVYSPVAALRSLSSVALSSEQAPWNLSKMPFRRQSPIQ